MARLKMAQTNQQNRYSAIIERIFQSRYRKGMREVDFEREEIVNVARELDIRLPKNLGDLLYSFRFRMALPASIRNTASQGNAWIIRLAGRGRYRFVLVPDQPLSPNEHIAITKVPDGTPGIISKYALTDEQALLAKVRYNRLIDIFTGITCYSLQNHLRTAVRQLGQIETDELYVGVDKAGIHYVLPVQAKGGRDRLGIVQIEQDFALCADKFPLLVRLAVACQFMQDDVIAMFMLEETGEGVRLTSEKHYKLVAPEEVTEADLSHYIEQPRG